MVRRNLPFAGEAHRVQAIVSVWPCPVAAHVSVPVSARNAKPSLAGPRTVALVPAAGRGLRMGGHIPKQFLALGGRPILAQSLLVLQASPLIHEIILAVPESERQ